MIFHFRKAPESFLDPDVIDYLNGLARRLVFDKPDAEIAEVFQLGSFLKASMKFSTPFERIFNGVIIDFPLTLTIAAAATEKGVHRQAIYDAVAAGNLDATDTEPAQVIVNAKFRQWTTRQGQGTSGGKKGRSGRPKATTNNS